jgi:hypothetical protein
MKNMKATPCDECGSYFHSEIVPCRKCGAFRNNKNNGDQMKIEHMSIKPIAGRQLAPGWTLEVNNIDLEEFERQCNELNEKLGIVPCSICNSFIHSSESHISLIEGE